MMKILFVCKYNRFRSKAAEAMFRHYIKREDIETKSAGYTIDPMRPYASKIVVELLDKKGIKIEDEQSRKIDERVIDWADKIIVVAHDVPLDTFPKNKTEVWKIKDSHEGDVDLVKDSLGKIEVKIKRLVKDLDNI